MQALQCPCCSCRFVALKHVPLAPAGACTPNFGFSFQKSLCLLIPISHSLNTHAGMSNLLPPQSLQVDPCTQAVAVAGYNWVALLPKAATNMSSTPDIPVLAVLPSFYSPEQKAPPRNPPSPTTPADSPAAPSAPEVNDPLSPTTSYLSDEAWLKAQTDAHRLEAIWMTSDLSSVADVVRHQQDQEQVPLLAASMPPAGLIRSVCFVGKHHNVLCRSGLTPLTPAFTIYQLGTLAWCVTHTRTLLSSLPNRAGVRSHLAVFTAWVCLHAWPSRQLVCKPGHFCACKGMGRHMIRSTDRC